MRTEQNVTTWVFLHCVQPRALPEENLADYLPEQWKHDTDYSFW